MAVTLVREEGHERQHPRFRIPVKVEIEGWNYPVQEWSIDGFSVRGVQGSETLTDSMPVKFIFRFDGFSAVVDLDAQIVRRSEADKSIFCRFYDISEQQLTILRAVINAYLAGEFVSMGDLIQVIKRDQVAYMQASDEHASHHTRLQKWLGYARRVAGLGVLTALFACLIGFTVWVSYQRLYVVEGLSAAVSAPLVVVRAPQSSFFEPVSLTGDKLVNKGDAIAFMELVGGGAVTIDSPCDCQVLEYHALARQFVALGEPLLTLLPQDAKLYVSVQVELQAVKKIAIGNKATIRFAGGRTYAASVSRIRHSESLVRRLAAPLNNPLANVIAYHEVIVDSAEELPLDLLGSPATVIIDTFN